MVLNEDAYLDSVASHKLSVHSPSSLNSTAQFNKLDECIRIITSLFLDINILPLRKVCYFWARKQISLINSVIPTIILVYKTIFLHTEQHSCQDQQNSKTLTFQATNNKRQSIFALQFHALHDPTKNNHNRKLFCVETTLRKLTTISPYRSKASLRSENVVVFSIFPTKRVLVQPGSKSSPIMDPACDRWRWRWSLESYRSSTGKSQRTLTTVIIRARKKGDSSLSFRQATLALTCLGSLRVTCSFSYPIKPQHSHTNSPNWSLCISMKNKLREFDKKSENFPSSDYFINSHNLFSWLCTGIVRRKLC